MSNIIHLVQVRAEGSHIQESLDRLKNSLQHHGPAIITTDVKEPNLIQVISKQNLNSSALLKGVQTRVPIQINRDLFAQRDRVASAPFVEYVQNWFPLDVDKSSIEADFKRFDEKYLVSAEGEMGCVLGWSLEPQTHPDLPADDKRICLFVIRGWDSMDHFHASTQTKEFRESIPVLYAWGAPYKMWHTERRSVISV